jgi:hypothetical protein
MAVLTGQSTFSASLMGDDIELKSDGNSVGFGYAISYDGNPLAAVGGDGHSPSPAVTARRTRRGSQHSVGRLSLERLDARRQRSIRHAAAPADPHERLLRIEQSHQRGFQ